jgi:hypothetical protein
MIKKVATTLLSCFAGGVLAFSYRLFAFENQPIAALVALIISLCLLTGSMVLYEGDE